MAKECQSKKEQETRKCFKYKKEGHIVRNYKGKQSIKKQQIQEKLDDENKKEEQGFGNNLKQTQYKRSPMQIPRINMLF